VVNNALNETLLFKVPDGKTSEGAVDFQSFDEDALADESEGRDFLHNTFIAVLVDGNGVLGLVLDFALGPLLFLSGLASTGGGGCSFSLGLKTA
jgi:hypothetical protein